MRTKSQHSAVLASCVIGLVALLSLPGCQFFNSSRDVARSAFGGPSKAKEDFVGDPVALATVKTVAVLPFADSSPEPGFDAMGFATRFANQLTSRGQINVVYPQEVMARVEAENRNIRRHNAEVSRRNTLGIKTGDKAQSAILVDQAEQSLRSHQPTDEDTKKMLLDPVHTLDDAVKIGRLLKVDAIIMGRVTDFDPYMRPRISVSMQAVATGQSDVAALALAELTQWGIPRASTVARGIVWQIQQNFDTRDGNIGRNVQAYSLLKHTEHHPYDTDTYLRSASHFYDYVGVVLTNALLDARKSAVDEAEMRALQLAQQQQMTRDGMRNRIRNLTNPRVNLPDADAVLQTNLGDRNDREWRPDVYNRNHPDKQQKLDERRDYTPQ